MVLTVLGIWNFRDRQDVVEIEGWYLEIARSGNFWYFLLPSYAPKLFYFLFNFVLEILWKIKTVKATVHLQRVGRLCREWVCVVFLSALIMPPNMPLSNNREEYSFRITSFDISWPSRVFIQDKWENSHVVVAVLKSRNMSEVYLVERKGEGNRSEPGKLPLMDAILIIMKG